MISEHFVVILALTVFADSGSSGGMVRRGYGGYGHLQTGYGGYGQLYTGSSGYGGRTYYGSTSSSSNFGGFGGRRISGWRRDIENTHQRPDHSDFETLWKPNRNGPEYVVDTFNKWPKTKKIRNRNRKKN